MVESGFSVPPPRLSGISRSAPHLVRRSDVPTGIGHGSPYAIPAILIALLALDPTLQGSGLCAQLLRVALERATEATGVAGHRLILVDIDDAAPRFYEHLAFGGFQGPCSWSPGQRGGCGSGGRWLIPCWPRRHTAGRHARASRPHTDRGRRIKLSPARPRPVRERRLVTVWSQTIADGGGQDSTAGAKKRR